MGKRLHSHFSKENIQIFVNIHKAYEKVFNITAAAATAAKSLQSCPTLCDPIDGSQPGSPVPGILQARTLESGLPFSSSMRKSEK